MKSTIINSIVALSLVSFLSACNEVAVAKKDYTINGNIYTTSTFTYTGDIVNEQPNGYGMMTFTWGDSYDGEVVKGELEGFGRMLYADGSMYTGDFHSSLRSGHGRIVMSDGSSYDGSWKNGSREGYGILVSADGVRQIGYFENDQPKKVVLLDVSNCVSGDCWNGTGVEKTAVGTYTGHFKNGEYSGKGTMCYSNGDTYDGMWVAGLHSGAGIFNSTTEQYTINGYFVRGSWVEGLKTYAYDRPDFHLMRNHSM